MLIIINRNKINSFTDYISNVKGNNHPLIAQSPRKSKIPSWSSLYSNHIDFSQHLKYQQPPGNIFDWLQTPQNIRGNSLIAEFCKLSNSISWNKLKKNEKKLKSNIVSSLSQSDWNYSNSSFIKETESKIFLN